MTNEEIVFYADKLLPIFQKNNTDALEEGEEDDVIPFTDVEFYSDQVRIILTDDGTPVSAEDARLIAIEISKR